MCANHAAKNRTWNENLTSVLLKQIIWCFRQSLYKRVHLHYTFTIDADNGVYGYEQEILSYMPMGNIQYSFSSWTSLTNDHLTFIL